MSSKAKYAKVRQGGDDRTIRDDENLSTEEFRDRLRIIDLR